MTDPAKVQTCVPASQHDSAMKHCENWSEFRNFVPEHALQVVKSGMIQSLDAIRRK